MSKREKRLQKLRQNPKNVAFDDLKQVLEDYGFELDHATGSHFIFRLKVNNTAFRVVIPFGRPVKSRYVIQTVETIDQVRQMSGVIGDDVEDNNDRD